MAIDLTPDQARALQEIVRRFAHGERHLLTGYAGTGKTTLMQAVARHFVNAGRTVVLTAPTHKAVSVLAAKVREAGLQRVDCITIHSLLSLQPKPDGERIKLVRRKSAKSVTVDVVIIDECSMVSADLMAHINRHLRSTFVLFVGDPAQLPPVGEERSETFTLKHRSHLDTIIRQAASNPLLIAARIIRESQGTGGLDWSWCTAAKAAPLGVYLPDRASDLWMQKAFTSDRFARDKDAFRYLCWTNQRVAEVNKKVRYWIYGSTNTPFSVGETVMFRAPVFINDVQVFSTNEEAPVRKIERSEFAYPFGQCGGVDAWVAQFPSWKIELESASGAPVEVHMAQNHQDYGRIDDRLKNEAFENGARWGHRHEFAGAVAKLQSIFALTVHTSQGSTFGNVFVDVPDIRRRARSNVLETQQLLYVAATRPKEALILVGMADMARAATPTISAAA